MPEDPPPPVAAARRTWRPDAAVVVLGLAAVLLTALLLSQLGFVPIWDGRIYADCVLDAARQHLRPASLQCADHTTFAYILLLALPQLLHHGSFAAMLLTNLALAFLALAAFFRLLRGLFPVPDRRLDLALLVLALAVHPVVVAAALQPNVDFGVMVFFLPCLAALLEKRMWATVGFAAAMCFSKETGAVVYAATLGLYALYFVTLREGPVRAKLATLRAMAPYSIPLLAVGLYYSVKPLLRPHVHVIWTAPLSGDPLQDLTSFRLFDPVLYSYLTALFCLNFLWVPALLLGYDTARGVLRAVFLQPPRPVSGSEPTQLRFVSLLTLALVYLLTRYRTFTNLRYFLVLYPLLLLAFYAAMSRVGLGAWPRRAALVVLAGLFLGSNVRAFDPVTRAVYGTFRVGPRALLDMTAVSRECCGHGRDQLVYNLEFTGFGDVQNEMFQALRPAPDTLFVLDFLADWYVLGRLDARTFRRTLSQDPATTFEIRKLDARQVSTASALPRRAYYVAFSYVGNRGSMTLVSRRYRILEPRVFARGGFALTVYPLEAP